MQAAIKLKNAIESFFYEYGITSRKKLNYEVMWGFLQLKGFENIATTEGRFSKLNTLINNFSGGLYITDYKKYFTTPVPSYLEDTYKQFVETMHIKVDNKNNALLVGFLKESIPTFGEEYDELMSYLSLSWQLQTTFINNNDRSLMARREAFKYFTEYAFPVKNAILNELPERIIQTKR
ncbi:hypothetical protein MZM54_03880 [[Brevibacterium] frigoritolerans]|nr:hypothetical protein [Peribacillus frigoritolerans]